MTIWENYASKQLWILINWFIVDDVFIMAEVERYLRIEEIFKRVLKSILQLVFVSNMRIELLIRLVVGKSNLLNRIFLCSHSLTGIFTPNIHCRLFIPEFLHKKKWSKFFLPFWDLTHFLVILIVDRAVWFVMAIVRALWEDIWILILHRN